MGTDNIFTKKKNYTEYRSLNKATLKNHYYMTRIEDMFDKLKGAGLLSKINMSSGYHMLRIREETISMTTFRT